MGEYIAGQLLPQTPLLVAYVVGMVLALAYLSAARTPAVLTLIAVSVLLAATIGGVVANAYFFLKIRPTAVELGHISMTIAIITGLLRAAAIGCLLAAAFTGRRASAAGVADRTGSWSEFGVR